MPIEVVHFHGEMTDLKQRQQVEELGGTLVQVSTLATCSDDQVRGVSKAEGVWKVGA